MPNKKSDDGTKYVSVKMASEILGILPSNTGRLCRRNGVTPVIGTWYLRKHIEKLKQVIIDRIENPKPAKIKPMTLPYVGKRGKTSKLDPYVDDIIKSYQSGTRIVQIAEKYGVSRAWIYQFIGSRIGG